METIIRIVIVLVVVAFGVYLTSSMLTTLRPSESAGVTFVGERATIVIRSDTSAELQYQKNGTANVADIGLNRDGTRYTMTIASADPALNGLRFTLDSQNALNVCRECMTPGHLLPEVWVTKHDP